MIAIIYNNKDLIIDGSIQIYVIAPPNIGIINPKTMLGCRKMVVKRMEYKMPTKTCTKLNAK